MSEASLLEEILPDLQKQDGKLWVRILGQTHWQFNEIPFWILVKDQDQIKYALVFLQKQLRRLQPCDGADITVSFSSFEANKEYHYGMFKGEDFFADDALGELYEKPFISERDIGVFDHQYPNEEWAIKG